MLISETIKVLLAIMEEDGDLELIIEDEHGNGFDIDPADICPDVKEQVCVIGIELD